MAPKVKTTYSSRSSRSFASSSPPPASSSSPQPASRKRQRPLEDHLLNVPLPLPKKRVKPNAAIPQKHKTLTQLHFCVDTTILRTCSLCNLSYTHGAPDDEMLHRRHCARVQKGTEWGKEEEREKIKADVKEVKSGIKIKDNRKGRVICFRANVGGKVGAKLATLLKTIDLALSSPPLPADVLRDSKAYLFLLPTGVSGREKIVGCVIAQRIKTAMEVASDAHVLESQASSEDSRPQALIPVDPSSSLFCHPEPLSTPLGIPRLFVSSIHRRQGIATHLLTAAAETFVHGCPLDPGKGEVAFTQPTGLGLSVMRKWGGGAVRVYGE